MFYINKMVIAIFLCSVVSQLKYNISIRLGDIVYF